MTLWPSHSLSYSATSVKRQNGWPKRCAKQTFPSAVCTAVCLRRNATQSWKSSDPDRAVCLSPQTSGAGASMCSKSALWYALTYRSLESFTYIGLAARVALIGEALRLTLWRTKMCAFWEILSNTTPQKSMRCPWTSMTYSDCSSQDHVSQEKQNLLNFERS